MDAAPLRRIEEADTCQSGTALASGPDIRRTGQCQQAQGWQNKLSQTTDKQSHGSSIQPPTGGFFVPVRSLNALASK